MKSSLEIAQEAVLRPIMDVATEMGLEEDEVDLYGKYKAKIDLGVIDRLSGAPDAKIVCVSAITPTKAGEGKTTTSVSLTQGLGAIGKRPILCLREPSLGPIFGIKGGAAGGGLTQVVPMEDLNLHFTGDFHAIAAANNMLAAFVDRHIFYGNDLKIDPFRRQLAAGGRHERPPPAQHHHRPGRPHPRHPARDRLRHRGRLRGDGDHGHGHLAAGSAQADRLRSRSPTTSRGHRSPPSRWAAPAP